ncbi:hypothetical protein LCGC14_1225810 [marine sediment metagenome]|uniref:Uncharacterized protein n=1 Tax=marine sediment metagenome TaxID=412755 RepID=A0A0F9LDX4_9ZZZZ
MIKYTGKAKCFCGKRAKFKLERGFSGSLFRCKAHAYTIENLQDEIEDDDRDTLADEQIFGIGYYT